MVKKDEEDKKRVSSISVSIAKTVLFFDVCVKDVNVMSAGTLLK